MLEGSDPRILVNDLNARAVSFPVDGGSSLKGEIWRRHINAISSAILYYPLLSKHTPLHCQGLSTEATVGNSETHRRMFNTAFTFLSAMDSCAGKPDGKRRSFIEADFVSDRFVVIESFMVDRLCTQDIGCLNAMLFILDRSGEKSALLIPQSYILISTKSDVIPNRIKLSFSSWLPSCFTAILEHIRTRTTLISCTNHSTLCVTAEGKREAYLLVYVINYFIQAKPGPQVMWIRN